MKNRVYKQFIWFICFLCSVSLYGQSSDLKMFTFEEVDSFMIKAPKQVVVFFHTDWCKYCHLMNETTFQNKKIVKILNDRFYFISFNAESQKTIKFAGQTFTYIPKGNSNGIHEIATQLASVDGKLNYPSVCVLNSKYEIVFQYNQYLAPSEFLVVLNKLKDSK